MSIRAALIVAAGSYQDPKFKRLRAPSYDAKALARVLGDPHIGSFQVQALIDEPTHVVSEEIEGFFQGRSPDDLLLLYFSCHGIKDASGRLFFVLSSTKFDRLRATGIAASWVNEELQRSLSKAKIVLLDCCYSGAFAHGFSPKSALGVDVIDQLQGEEGRGSAVITASDSMEYAFEGDKPTSIGRRRTSVFTDALIEGLRTGEADRDGDGKVSVEDLYDYLYNKVREGTPNQRPTISTIRMRGAVYVARSPQGKRKVLPDLSLQGMLDNALERLEELQQHSDGDPALQQLTAYSAEAASRIRIVLKALSVEVNDCPRLFTMVPKGGSRRRRPAADQDGYRLTLWCEHPGYEHPWTEASYDLRSTGWPQRLAPYAVLVSKALRVLVPMASANRLVVEPQELESVERELALMTSLVEKLPPLDQSNVGAIQNAQGLTRAEGASLRELRSFLFEVDESRYFGGLRRVLASSGDFLWVCPNHYVQYDPGLPSLPA